MGDFIKLSGTIGALPEHDLDSVVDMVYLSDTVLTVQLSIPKHTPWLILKLSLRLHSIILDYPSVALATEGYIGPFVPITRYNLSSTLHSFSLRILTT